MAGRTLQREARRLLEAANFNRELHKENELGLTALMAVAANGQIDLMLALLKRNAKVADAASADGWTALMFASASTPAAHAPCDALFFFFFSCLLSG